MDSKTLMEAYMRAKNYTSYAQVCQDLGFSSAYIAGINKGRAQFTDETAKFLAEGAGLDPFEVIISLNAVRAKTPEMRETWYGILKKYCASTGAALAVACVMMGSLDSEPSVTAHNVYYVKLHILLPVTTY
ncbi:transcriptional regulator [Aeromonas veronii]|uniref:transcriptional regulator n=1 Tax=Aeromonas veronii TaxID=654 RepID=UPI000C284078|nr:transcriptional regulator [Aeromonas veronii]ATY81103.1 transcriptional regulator [Aeromonas veronii]